MTDTIKNLLKCISNDEYTKAKQVALMALKEDTTKKDENFRNSLIAKIESQKNFIALPQNVSGFLVAEDLNTGFDGKRYFISEAEKKTFDEILTADKVAEVLAAKGIKYSNLTLLYGESGTGKTTFGRYLAYILGIPFMYLNLSNVISSYLGKTGQNLSAVFEFVKSQRCVFMLDEIDAIGLSRNDIKEVGEMSRIVITLMQNIDALPNSSVVLAATNRPDMIDDALKRRFTRLHEVSPFSKTDAFCFARNYLNATGYGNISDVFITKIIGDAVKASEIEKAIIQYIIQVETEKLGLESDLTKKLLAERYTC